MIRFGAGCGFGFWFLVVAGFAFLFNSVVRLH